MSYAEVVPVMDKYLTGIQWDKDGMQARIYHDRPLTDEDVVHELLHLLYPDWSEDQVNYQTTLYLAEIKPKQRW